VAERCYACDATATGTRDRTHEYERRKAPAEQLGFAVEVSRG
jgi:hypothetical protein